MFKRKSSAKTESRPVNLLLAFTLFTLLQLLPAAGAEDRSTLDTHLQPAQISAPEDADTGNRQLMKLVGVGDPLPGRAVFSGLAFSRLGDNGDVTFANKTGIFRSSGGRVATLVKAGDTAPDGSPITTIYSVSVNGLGQVAFSGGGGILWLNEDNSLQTMVSSRQQAPGGGTFSSFYDPSLNNAGQLVFDAFTSNPSGSGLFLRDSNGQLQRLLSSGQAAPGGGTFSSFSAVLNDAGVVAFRALTINPNGSGIFLRDLDGQLRAVARSGQTAPGGGVFSEFYDSDLSLNKTGQVAFSASTNNPNGSGLFLKSADGELRAVAREGQSAPGGGTFGRLNGGGTFGRLNRFQSFALTDRDEVVFAVANVIDAVSAIFLFVLDEQGAPRLMRLNSAGQPAPGGGTFDRFLALSLNRAGQRTFLACTRDPSGQAIFLVSGEAMSRIVSDGDPVPEGTILAEVSRKKLNNHQQVAFFAWLVGGAGGLFLASGDEVQLVALQEDEAPGGGRFRRLYDYDYGFLLNDTGEVAFKASLSLDTRTTGVFLKGRDGRLRAVVRADRTGPDAFWFVNEFALNDAGQVAFQGDALRICLGIFLREPDGRLRRVVCAEDPAPDGGRFAFYPNLRLVALNDLERVLFHAHTENPNGEGLFLRRGDGPIAAVARAGQPAPGGGTFNGFSEAGGVINHAGEVAFLAWAGSPSGAGLFLRDRNNQLQAVARAGQSAPGGGVFAPYFLQGIPELNDAGEVAFYAGTINPDGSGFFLWDRNRQLQAVARIGAAAPGGGLFGEINFSRSLNNAGEVAFRASTRNPEGSGLFLRTRNGRLETITRAGHEAPDGGRFTYLGSPRFNEARQVVFSAWTTRGAGIYMSKAAFAYVTNGSSNTLSLIDTVDSTPIDTALRTGNGPWGVAINNHRAYVTNFYSNSVSVINTATNAVLGVVNVGPAPTGVAAAETPSGPRAYVANFGSNTVSVINAENNTVVATVTVGAAPVGVAVSSDGTRAYVTNSGSDSVAVIDTATNTVAATIAVGRYPYGVALTPDGARAYVVNRFLNTVSVIDTAAGTVMVTIPVGSEPLWVAITPDGAFAYVTNFSANSVSVIDTEANTVVATINEGIGNEPRGIAITSDGARAYVANAGSDSVSVIDTEGNRVVERIAVGRSPFNVAIMP